MKTSDFDYILPPESIAQRSVEPRDASKMMVIDRAKKTRQDTIFREIVDFFQEGDVLVWNNTKVFKARLQAKLLSPTGRDLFEHKRDIELFLVRPKTNPGVWQALVRPGRHVKNGMRISVAEDFYCDVLTKKRDGTLLVQFPYSDAEVRAKANQYGSVPIPPYVKDEKHQLETYQTVYAQHEGSVAAPTAGFHFTDTVISTLKEKGVLFAEVTLHVGLGTFLPVKVENVEDHVMHEEWVSLDEKNAACINLAKQEGRRVIAVGTTSVRSLESIAQFTHKQCEHLLEMEPTATCERRTVKEFQGDVNLFITPGFQFQVVDALMTNFHLPKSTLLMLVSAFAGDRKFLLDCYRYAVENKYRFYSFGDAMFIY